MILRIIFAILLCYPILGWINTKTSFQEDLLAFSLLAWGLGVAFGKIQFILGMMIGVFLLIGYSFSVGLIDAFHKGNYVALLAFFAWILLLYIGRNK